MGTMCGDLLCPYGDPNVSGNKCARWVGGSFVATGWLRQRRQEHLCWARPNGVHLLGEHNPTPGVRLLGGRWSEWSSEFVVLDGAGSVPGFGLIGPTLGSCGVDMGDLYVVIGGENTKLGGGALRNVTLYNDDGFVRNLPDLVMGRFYHACAGFQDINGDMVGLIFLYS